MQEFQVFTGTIVSSAVTSKIEKPIWLDDSRVASLLTIKVF